MKLVYWEETTLLLKYSFAAPFNFQYYILYPYLYCLFFTDDPFLYESFSD